MANAALGQLIIIAPSPNVGATTGRDALGKILTRDYQDGGNMMLTGIVTSNGAPARRRVRLFDQTSGRLVRETWSDAITGVYKFEYIRPGMFIVLGHDHTGAYDPEAKADLQSEPMP